MGVSPPALPLELGRTGDWVIRAWPAYGDGAHFGRVHAPHRVAAVNSAGVMIPPNPQPTVAWEQEGARLLESLDQALDELGRIMRDGLRAAARNACPHCGR